MLNMYVGKYVNTHGIKGEIKIKSDIDHKDLIFKVGNVLKLNGKDYKIKNYRVHKEYDMVSFEGINDINEILPYKGMSVFIDRDSIEENVIFYSDYIGKTLILNGEKFGEVIDYSNTLNPLLICKHDDSTFYIPLNGDFIECMSGYSVVLNESAKELIL